MWTEVENALEAKRCELIISGAYYSEKIEKDGLDIGIFKLKQLNFLEISKTCLREIPACVGELTNLTRIAFCFNALEFVPAEVCKLQKLKFLDVSHNAITSLPDDIGLLTELQSLNVSSNQLSEMPALDKLVKLVLLNISNNEFQKLPQSIFSKNLIHFTDFIANNNCITEVPLEITQLGCLKILDLGENKISTIPGELGSCTKIKELNLKGNNLRDNRLLKLVHQCNIKQLMDYVKNHCPKTIIENSAQGKSKKKGKHNKKSVENEEVLDVLDEMKILHVREETKKVVSSRKMFDIRPYIVCCIVRDVSFEGGVLLKKFITLQTKLHDGICEKRTMATIATHDLLKIDGNLLYDARPPQNIKILPLNKKKEMTAAELYKNLNEEADAIRKEKKKNAYSGIHKYLYLLKDKPIYPCLLDSSDRVISLPPITNSDGTKISEDTKNMLLEVTGNSLNCCKKVMDALLAELLKLGIGHRKDTGSDEQQVQHLLVEQVQVVDEEGKLRVVYPSRTDLQIEGITVNRE